MGWVGLLRRVASDDFSARPDLRVRVQVLGAMAQKDAANGNGATTRPPPTPSPIRFSKFFQVSLGI